MVVELDWNLEWIIFVTWVFRVQRNQAFYGGLRFRWKEATLCSTRLRTLSTHNTGSTTQTEYESVEQFTFPNPTGNLPRNPSGQHKGLVTTDGPWDQNGLHSSIACVLDAEDG